MISSLITENLGKMEMVHQDEAAECGLACLAMISRYHGYDIDLFSARSRYGSHPRGINLTSLIKTAHDMGLDCRPLRVEIENLVSVKLPAIIHWQFNHFVVLDKVRRRAGRTFYEMRDPALGRRNLSEAEFSAGFTGVLVEAIPNIKFERRRERAKLSLWQLFNKASGIKSALYKILLLSTFVEIFALAIPFYMQIAIDDVIPSHDVDFINALAIGFGGLAVLNQLTTFTRNWATINLSNELSYRIVSNLFRHLVRLPISWFVSRSVGDVMVRFNSTQAITDVMSHGLLQAFIDAALAMLTLTLMFAYSPTLALIALAALAVYTAVRLTYFSALKANNLSVLQAQAQEQANFIETVRGITPIRLFGNESNRARTWQNKKVQVVNATVKIARLKNAFASLNSAVVALENIAFIYIAVRLAINGKMTVGMITAFGAYKHQFLDASLNVIGQALDYRMLDVQLGRIGDIALTPVEEVGGSGDIFDETQMDGGIEKIELRDVSFSYAKGDPAILKCVNLVVTRGETIAIVGTSGSGKSTLLRVLMGLVTQTAGDLLVNDCTIRKNSLADYRKMVSCVMQEDVLFSGTIADNISFFEAQIDRARVEEVAKIAEVHEDICKMPMAYESLVGDMGSTLSGGQKQRLLIARALYRRPALLVMDEATAHLDRRTEGNVNRKIKELGIACIIVAHRPSTIAVADRKFELREGKLDEIVAPRDPRSRAL